MSPNVDSIRWPKAEAPNDHPPVRPAKQSAAGHSLGRRRFLMAAGLSMSILMVLIGYFVIKPYQVAPQADEALAGITKTLAESIDGGQTHLEKIQRALETSAPDPETLRLEQRVFSPLPGERQNLEVGSQKSDVGDQMSEVGSEKSDTPSPISNF